MTDIKEIKRTIKGLSNDLSNLNTLSKAVFANLLSKQYDEYSIGECFYSILTSIMKVSSYDLDHVLHQLDSLVPTKEPEKVTVQIDEPVKEVEEIPDNIGNTTSEEPEKELTYNNKKEIFKKRLRKLRARNNISMKELASLMNKSYSIVYSWEAKGCIPKQNTLEELAKLFNVPSQYLIGEGE